MELFDVPEDVFYRDILPKLSWNDLLTVRSVSKFSHQMLHRYLWSQPWRVPELEINETNMTMEKFVRMGIPTTKLYLNNQESGVECYKSSSTNNVKSLLLEYMSRVHYLRVHSMSQIMVGKERRFFNEFRNLKSLEVRNWIGPRYCTQPSEDALFNIAHSPFPMSFRKLKKLNINMKDVFLNPDDMQHVNFSSALIILFCVELQDATVPFCDYQTSFGAGYFQSLFKLPTNREDLIQYKYLSIIDRELQTRFSGNDSNGQQGFRTFSFKNFYNNYDHKSLDDFYNHERFTHLAFHKLCLTCVRYGVTLEMVNAAWFQSFLEHLDYLNVTNTGSCIISMVNIHPTTNKSIIMLNLEKLVIESISRCQLNIENGFRPEWPSLKVINITLDSRITGQAYESTFSADGQRNIVDLKPVSYHHILSFLFKDISRPQMTELNITFTIQVACPQSIVDSIVSACPALKRIALKNWTGTNKSLTTFWTGLRELEEITLDTCKTIGNVAFVGLDIKNPVFFRLRRLKKLSLLGLDEMPKLTDALFKIVLSQMPLINLTLSSRGKIVSVTTQGVRALLSGEFAQSVRSFSFRKWSLANCSDEEFKKLQSEFANLNVNC